MATKKPKAAKPAKQHLVALVLGDWSCDGHNQSEKLIFSSEYTKSEIMEAYLAGCKKTGVCLHCPERNTSTAGCVGLFVEYEDCVVPADIFKKLQEFGLDVSVFGNEDNEDGSLSCGPEDAAEIFKFLVALGSLGEKNIKLTPFKILDLNGYGDKDYNFSIGYGLYGS